MSIDPAILRALHAAGATTEMIIAAVEAAAVVDQVRLEMKRHGNAERQRRFRAGRKAVANDAHDDDGNAGNALPSVTDVTDPLSLSPNENNSNPHTHTPEHKPRARKGSFVLPERIPSAEWAAFVEMRQRIRKPLTDHGKGLAIERLDKLAADGWPPGDVLNHATMSSNQGLWPPPKDYQNGRLPQRANGVGGSRPDASGASIFDELERRRSRGNAH